MDIIPHDELIKKLDICIAACNFSAFASLQDDNVKSMTRCIELSLDCAEVCRTTGILLARNSEHGKHLLDECIELCEACAAESGKFDHAHCKACTKACRDCAEACRTAA